MSAEHEDQDIPVYEFIPPNVPRSMRKESAIAMMPVFFRGRSLMLAIQLDQDPEDGNVVISLDLEDWTPHPESAMDDDSRPETAGTPLPRSHFCTLKLNPGRVITTHRAGKDPEQK